MKQTSTDRKLSDIADKVVRRFGLDGATAEFVQSKFFQTKWRKTDSISAGVRYRSVHFRMTDYMRRAPDSILEEYLILVTYSLLNEDIPEVECSEEFSAFVDSPEFLIRGRRMYLLRSYTIEASDGEDALAYARAWLDVRNLIPSRAADAVLFWDKSRRRVYKSNTNIMFGVVEIPYELNMGPEENREAIAWLMFKQMCMMSTPFDPIGFSHEEDGKALLDRFPEDALKTAERQLQRAGLWNKDEME